MHVIVARQPTSGLLREQAELALAPTELIDQRVHNRNGIVVEVKVVSQLTNET